MMEAFLTKEQINEIIEKIPLPPGIGERARRIARNHTVKRLISILKQIKIVQTKDAFEEFKGCIIEQQYKSYIEAGRPVGATAAISVAGPITQMSLNTFHYAGSQSGVSDSFKKINDYLNGSSMNRDPRMLVFFKDPRTGTDIHDVLHKGNFNDIMNLRPEIEQTTVKDIIIDKEILSSTEKHKIAKIRELLNFQAILFPRKFNDYRNKFLRENGQMTYVLELTLDSYRMYTHKITMKMVSEAIEGPVSSSGILNNGVICVWETLRDQKPKIYILLDETRSYGGKGISKEEGKLMFFHQYFMKQFPKFHISGLKDILAINPVSIDVRGAVYKIKRSKISKNIVRVYTTNVATRWDGVSLMDIFNMFEKAGFKGIRSKGIPYINRKKLFIGINYSSDYETETTRDLLEEFDERHSKAFKRNEKRNDNPSYKKELIENDIKILDSSKIYYIETEGINTDDFVWREDVDHFRTHTDKPHIMVNELGIDAVRIYLIYKFKQMLTSFSAYINPRHISVMFDLLTSLGIINSLTFAGVNRRGIGPLTLASYEHVMSVFVDSAAFGMKEEISGISSSLYVGQKSNIVGTGSIKVEKKEIIKEIILPTEEEISIDIQGLTDVMKQTREKYSLSSLIGETPKISIKPDIETVKPKDIEKEILGGLEFEVGESDFEYLDIHKPEEGSGPILTLGSPEPLTDPSQLRDINTVSIIKDFMTPTSIKMPEKRITNEDLPSIPTSISSTVVTSKTVVKPIVQEEGPTMQDFLDLIPDKVVTRKVEYPVGIDPDINI